MTFTPLSAPDDAPPVRVRLSTPTKWGGGTTSTLVASACQNPNCTCTSVFLTFERADAEEGTSICFDHLTHETWVSEGAREATRLIASELANSLQPENWEWISSFFRAAKRRLFENLDITRITPWFPDNVRADPARLVYYSEVFPCAPPLEFEFQGARWIADDSYCSRPGCTCTRSALAFVRIPEQPAMDGAPCRPTSAAVRDYEAGTSGPETSSGRRGPYQALMAALLVAQPDLDRRLRQRHAHIHYLGARLYGPASALPTPSPTVTRSVPKVGRNDPCPCGSGLKYKRCCGKSA